MNLFRNNFHLKIRLNLHNIHVRESIQHKWCLKHSEKIKKCAKLFICRFDNEFICLISEKFLFFNTASDLCLPHTRIFNLNSKSEWLKLNYWTGSRKMVIFFSCTKNRNFSNFNKIFRWFISKLYIFYVSSIFFSKLTKTSVL